MDCVYVYIYIYLYHSFPLHPGQITNRLMVCYRWQVVPMRDGDACWPSTDCPGMIFFTVGERGKSPLPIQGGAP